MTIDEELKLFVGKFIFIVLRVKYQIFSNPDDFERVNNLI